MRGRAPVHARPGSAVRGLRMLLSRVRRPCGDERHGMRVIQLGTTRLRLPRSEQGSGMLGTCEVVHPGLAGFAGLDRASGVPRQGRFLPRRPPRTFRDLARRCGRPRRLRPLAQPMAGSTVHTSFAHGDGITGELRPPVMGSRGERGRRLGPSRSVAADLDQHRRVARRQRSRPRRAMAIGASFSRLCRDGPRLPTKLGSLISINDGFGQNT